MRASNILVIAAAVVCAAAAALLTKGLLSGSAEVEPPGKPVPAAVKTVVLAAVPLRFGTILTPEALVEVSWPAEAFPPGAFSSKDALLSAGSRTVIASIAKSEAIVASKVSAPGQRPSLSILIAEGKKAVTIRVDDVHGVAGFVQPDDRVDVLLTRGERSAVGMRPAPGSAYTDVLLQNVRVLAIDQLADRVAAAKLAKAITVEVETADAQKLVLAASVGQLSLALRRAGWTHNSETLRVGLEDLPAGRAEAVPPPVEEPTVTIFRGASDRKRYDLSPEGRGQASELQAAEAAVERAEKDNAVPR
jgi:pilus assembly protein CpaB